MAVRFLIEFDRGDRPRQDRRLCLLWLSVAFTRLDRFIFFAVFLPFTLHSLPSFMDFVFQEDLASRLLVSGIMHAVLVVQFIALK